MGFGGKTTVLTVKIDAMERLPASYFVTASYMCWADRRRTLTYRNGDSQDRVKGAGRWHVVDLQIPISEDAIRVAARRRPGPAATGRW